MEVICLQDAAFYALLETVVERLKDKQDKKDDKWILGEEVMKILGISSKTTLQKLRDNGEIMFSQNGKMILYNVDSVNAYIMKNVKKPF